MGLKTTSTPVKVPWSTCHSAEPSHKSLAPEPLRFRTDPRSTEAPITQRERNNKIRTIEHMTRQGGYANFDSNAKKRAQISSLQSNYTDAKIQARWRRKNRIFHAEQVRRAINTCQNQLHGDNNPMCNPRRGYNHVTDKSKPPKRARTATTPQKHPREETPHKTVPFQTFKTIKTYEGIRVTPHTNVHDLVASARLRHQGSSVERIHPRAVLYGEPPVSTREGKQL